MNYRRIILYFALAFIAFTLWTNWLRDYGAKPEAAQLTPSTAQTTSDVPNATPPATSTVPTAAINQVAQATTTAQTPANRLVTVKTDVLEVKIDTVGGNLVEVGLLQYPEKVNTPDKPVLLINTNPDTYYVAQSGITGAQGPDTQQGQATYTPEKTNYEMAPEQNELLVNLSWKNNAGVIVTKTFAFKRGEYAIHVTNNIQNNSNKAWEGNFYAQIKRKPEPKQGGLFHLSTFSGASFSTPEKPYEKLSYSKMDDENLSTNVHGGWVAMQQRYFLTSWIPNQQQTNHFYSSVDANKLYTIGYIGPNLDVDPNSSLQTINTIYVGPEIEKNLKPIAPNLNLTIDYGWLWIISVAIFWVMEKIYHVVGNWGWSIVLVTVLIKLIFYKLSETSYRSMAKMRNLQPKMKELKERYGDDRQKFSQATMELYKKEKINPLSGCLPILVQIPVFIALYYVLIESVQLRHAPFIFWIHDLSARDPYFILPILMGLSMYAQQLLNTTLPDPVQARVMQLLPVIFTIFFLTFPSGLVLYWLTNSVISILQQWYIMRKVETQSKKPQKGKVAKQKQ